MGCHPFQLKTNNGKTTNGIICLANIYKFRWKKKDWLFEVHHFCGPFPVRKKDLELFKRCPGENSDFWVMYDKFSKLSPEEQKKHCVFY